jgi:hypothetical protein
VSRLHTDAVEVARHDDLPAQFLWRGPALRRARGAGPVDRVRGLVAAGRRPGGVRRAVRQSGPAAAAGEPAGLDDGEQDWFRVEAGAGRAAGTGVYDLCHHTATGGWSLARVLD